MTLINGPITRSTIWLPRRCGDDPATRHGWPMRFLAAPQVRG